ncbi:hypothetical protein BGW38_010036, partial [Lunasporangiospora selenospora]
LRATELGDDAIASMIGEGSEDDVDDEYQEELYEVDDQVQEYRPAIYRRRPNPLASSSHVDEGDDEDEDEELPNPHLHDSEDALRTPTRSRVPEARTPVRVNPDSYFLEDAPRTPTRSRQSRVPEAQTD